MTTTHAPAHNWITRDAETIKVNGEPIEMPGFHSLRLDEEREIRPGYFVSIIVEAIVGYQDDCLGGGFYLDVNGRETNPGGGEFGQMMTGFDTAEAAIVKADEIIEAAIAAMAA